MVALLRPPSPLPPPPPLPPLLPRASGDVWLGPQMFALLGVVACFLLGALIILLAVSHRRRDGADAR